MSVSQSGIIFGDAQSVAPPKKNPIHFCRRWDHQGWDYFFNGKSVSGLAVEDVNAMAWDGSHGRLLLNILDTGSVMGHAVTQKDIFAINHPGYSWGGVAWHGPDHGWNYNIDAIKWTGW